MVDGERIPYRRMPGSARRRTGALGHPGSGPSEDRRDGIESDQPRHDPQAARGRGELLDTDYDDYCQRLSGVDFDALEA